MPVISDTDTLDFNVPFNTEIVQKFNEIAFKEIIANNITQNFELEKLRDWLLPMLMNGQVTIND
jgi:type I restriction enzyme S subunit